MNLFIRELKANRTALIIWSVCMFLLVVSGMAKYSAYSSGGQALNDMFAKMPFSLKALLGFGSFDMSRISGYFAMLFLYIEIAAAIHAVLLGSGIIAKEECDKTTEFLMAKPISRTGIVTAKLLAALVNILILNLVTLASSIMLVDAYNKGRDVSGEIAMFLLSMFLVQLIFLSLGTMLSSFIKNSKTAGSLAAGILLAAFVISRITDMTSRLNFLNVLSPFKYFSYQDMANGNGLNIGIILLSLALIAILFVLTYVLYRKRDLNV
jgi:ABC-2 type transport system permease protein